VAPASLHNVISSVQVIVGDATLIVTCIVNNMTLIFHILSKASMWSLIWAATRPGLPIN